MRIRVPGKLLAPSSGCVISSMRRLFHEPKPSTCSYVSSTRERPATSPAGTTDASSVLRTPNPDTVDTCACLEVLTFRSRHVGEDSKPEVGSACGVS